jgi:hypothetical protein
MRKMVLYRKELDLLDLAKNYISSNDWNGYISNVRDAIPDLFYENNFNLRSEFIGLIPVGELSKVRKLLDFLRMVSSYSGTQFFSNGGMHKDVVALSQEVAELSELMKKQLNLLSQFKVFYSWQSDSTSTFNRNFIENNLNKAIKKLNTDSDIQLTLDKDTLNEAGSPDIINTILRKIDEATVFVADVTAICKTNEDKFLSNPNVMFELGYAFSTLSDERVILICNTAICDTKFLPFDLGLKRMICYNYSENTSDEDKKALTEDFVKRLIEAIKTIRDI